MRLENWRKLAGKERSDVAAFVGVTVEAVRLWESGNRIPHRNQMKRLGELSEGAVTANDFYGHAPAE